MRPEPQERLGPHAATLFGLRQAVWALPVLVVALAISDGIRDDDALAALVLLLLAVAVVVIGCGVVPRARARRFRWALREEELELVRGAIVETRTLVPVARIQHVDVRRTPASRAFGLADLLVHTAAGTTTVPALADARALQARDALADLAREPDEL